MQTSAFRTLFAIRKLRYGISSRKNLNAGKLISPSRSILRWKKNMFRLIRPLQRNTIANLNRFAANSSSMTKKCSLPSCGCPMYSSPRKKNSEIKTGKPFLLPLQKQFQLLINSEQKKDDRSKKTSEKERSEEHTSEL